MKPSIVVLLLAGVVLLAASTPAPPRLFSGPLTARQVVHIQAVYGERTVAAGTWANYRVRIRPGATEPVEYYWDFGDGTRSEGALVAHRFATARQYAVVVKARNRYGSDSDTLMVTVTPATPPAPTPDTLLPTTRSTPPTPRIPASPAPEADEQRTRPVLPASLARHGDEPWPNTGYTWVVVTCLHREAADTEVRRYRSTGYRAGVIVDDRPAGSIAYRVVVGHFATTQEALKARPFLPEDRPGGLWLLDLATTSPL